jgi:hypothetical protein
VTLYAGLSMVTNAPFYSFKVVGGRRTVPFVVIVAIALGIALIAGPAAGAVRAVLRLRPVGLRGVRLAQVQGQADQRDRHQRPTSPTRRACTLEPGRRIEPMPGAQTARAILRFMTSIQPRPGARASPATELRVRC